MRNARVVAEDFSKF